MSKVVYTMVMFAGTVKRVTNPSHRDICQANAIVTYDATSDIIMIAKDRFGGHDRYVTIDALEASAFLSHHVDMIKNTVQVSPET